MKGRNKMNKIQNTLITITIAVFFLFMYFAIQFVVQIVSQ